MKVKIEEDIYAIGGGKKLTSLDYVVDKCEMSKTRREISIISTSQREYEFRGEEDTRARFYTKNPR